MKKSISSPNLQNFNKQKYIKKNFSTNALPTLDHLTSIITNEIQVESILNVSGLQAGSCMIENKMLSYNLLNSPIIDKNKKLMECLIDIDDFKNDQNIPKVNLIKRYYEICELNNEFAERYYKLLKIFSKKNKNSNE